MTGKLYIIATPIGNLGDVSKRMIDALKDANVLACEDTRRTRTLLAHLEILKPAKVISYRQGNEENTGAYIVKLMQEGQTVALCTDGGYPGISDPGYRLVVAAIEAGIEPDIIPGASAVPVALLKSGLPTSSYTFKGYPPKKRTAMLRFFEEEKDMPHTIIIFESPMRVGKTLQVALEIMGDRKAAVCRELTKKFETVYRGYLSELLTEFADGKTKGEVTIVIAGNNPKFLRDDSQE